MKKLFFLAIVALSMIACNKQQTDDNLVISSATVNLIIM